MCYFLADLAYETLTVKLGDEAPATFAEVLHKTKKVIDDKELLRTKTSWIEKKSDQKKQIIKKKGKSVSNSKDKESSSQPSYGPSDHRSSDAGFG